MEIRAKCRFDQASIKALTRLSVYKKHSPKKTVIARSIVAVILILMCIAEMIVFGFDSILIVLIVGSLLLILIDCYYYFLLPKIRYKMLANMQEKEVQYVFSDNALRVFTGGTEEYSGESTVGYSFLVKCYETSEYLFLFQTKMHVFIVDKSTVEGGSVDDIRAVLSGVLKEKYIVCKY